MQARLDLIGLIVRDMGRALAFYRRLGLDLQYLIGIVALNFAFTFSVHNISKLGHIGGFVAGGLAGLAIGGLPAALIAALIVKSLPLDVVRWLVVVVVTYTALNMLLTADQAETIAGAPDAEKAAVNA